MDNLYENLLNRVISKLSHPKETSISVNDIAKKYHNMSYSEFDDTHQWDRRHKTFPIEHVGGNIEHRIRAYTHDHHRIQIHTLKLSNNKHAVVRIDHSDKGGMFNTPEDSRGSLSGWVDTKEGENFRTPSSAEVKALNPHLSSEESQKVANSIRKHYLNP